MDIPWLEQHLDLNGKNKIAIFDIDSTIMDTCYRNYKILEEAAFYFDFLSPFMSLIEPCDIGWSILDAVSLHTDLTDTMQMLVLDFWRERFFSNAWVKHDRPYPGVKKVLDWFVEHDYSLVYLTGRDAPQMKEGTIYSFEANLLPTTTNTYFFFKPDFLSADLEYKKIALEAIGEIGDVVLAVENEPANANLMKHMFPQSIVALINTVTSPYPAKPLDSLLLFDGYK